MAAPFGLSLEDLNKLKSFIEYVGENPLILNLPELAFFKKFIEKFGGVVPEGEFQMPAGGKCPFGGDVKSETKSAPTPPPQANEPEDVEDAPAMEAESEESEVELDMEAHNVAIAEPNVLYLDEKPPKIAKNKKSTAAVRTTIKKSPKKAKTSRRLAKLQQQQEEYKIKKEISGKDVEDKYKEEKIDPNDPLYTPQVEIKTELNIEKFEPEIKLQYDESEDDEEDNENITKYDQNYEPEDDGDEQQDDSDDEDDEDDDDEDYDDNDICKTELQQMELTDEDDEEEPLIMLKSEANKRKEYQCKPRAPTSVKCLLSCKKQCNAKFNEDQRKRMCAYYWNLSKPERIEYLRKHIKAKRFTKYKFVRKEKRGSKCYNYYYLSDCIKHNNEEDDDENRLIDTSDLKRVCRRYFEATLCVSDYYLKQALTGFELELEKEQVTLVETIKANKEKDRELSQQIKEILDPETGNLITIDPKDKKKKKLKVPPSTATAELKPKVKRKRRKPNEPLPERFPKPIKCAIRCIHKCHTKFTEQERKQICDIFWTMDFKGRKDYILANIEVKELEKQVTPEFRTSNRPPRAYHTCCYLRTGLHGENKRVCKHFMVNTLCTSRTFISNAIEFADKTTGYYAGADRRGHQPVANRISEDRTKMLMDHIKSYPLWVPNKKAKTKYLHHSLTIKKMFEEYKEKCEKLSMKSVGIHYFYKFYHANFRYLFLTPPEPRKGGGCLNLNPNLSRYTGEEPGGFWLDSKGERLDLRFYNPAQSMDTFLPMPSNSTQDSFANINPSSLLQLNALNYTTTSAAAAQHLSNFMDPSLASSSSSNLNSRARVGQAPSLVRLDLNPNLYDNLPHGTSSLFRML